jgi:hypothetical protein
MASAARAKAGEQKRWPYFAAQRTFLYAGLGILIGAFLPWALILGQGLGASPMARAWTLWAGLMTLAGTMSKWRPLVVSSGFLGGGTAVYFAVWQTSKIVTACFSPQCLPGPGLGLMLFAGGAAFYWSYRMLRDRSL